MWAVLGFVEKSVLKQSCCKLVTNNIVLHRTQSPKMFDMSIHYLELIPADIR